MESNRIDKNSRVLLSTPLFHMNAMASGLLPCLSQGGSVVILKEFDAERVIDAIETLGCTYTTGVPSTYKLILAAARKRTHVDASSLEFIAVGSAPMTRALLDELVLTLPGVDVIEGYGLTESGPIITLNPRGKNKLGTIGPALPGFECKVIDSDGNILPQGEEGELVVRSELQRPRLLQPAGRRCEVLPGRLGLYRGYRGVRPRRLVHLQGARRRPDERGSRVCHSRPKARPILALIGCGIDESVPVPHEAKGQFLRGGADDAARVEPAAMKELIDYYVTRGPAYSHRAVSTSCGEMRFGDRENRPEGSCKAGQRGGQERGTSFRAR